jgi:DNA repair photolyase
MTLTTLNPGLQKFLEPHAVTIERRLDALRKLKAHRIPCGIHLMPIIPCITDSDEAIEGMIKTAAEIGVDYFVYNVLRLRGQVVKGYYFNVLKAYNPSLFQQTLKLYGARAYPPDAYVERLYQKVKYFREKWGLRTHWNALFGDKQMDLFK